MSVYSKKVSDKEREKIKNLLESVPTVNDLFDLHGKVGEGAFSSVFLATLKSSDEPKKKFAIKHLIPTLSLSRIERELQCLKNIGGTDHIAGLELCLRNLSSVVFVMPFMRHDKFADYVHEMGANETKNYMRALTTALRRVHKFNIIHRDIKPNNFLYDRRNQRYLLVDFGLAQVYKKNEKNDNTQPGKRKRADENSHNDLINKLDKSTMEKCRCFGNPTVCSFCQELPPQNAHRAGTPGYRAPEVLLKYPFQTTAIDVWAAGVILLCILSRTENFFQSPNDNVALAEIITLFGTNKVQQMSRKLGKKITCSENQPGVDITNLCHRLQKRNKLLKEEDNSNMKFPSEAYDLLTRMLDLDYQRRITAEKALDHPFLSS